jgi:hypothetical protein
LKRRGLISIDNNARIPHRQPLHHFAPLAMSLVLKHGNIDFKAATRHQAMPHGRCKRAPFEAATALRLIEKQLNACASELDWARLAFINRRETAANFGSCTLVDFHRGAKPNQHVEVCPAPSCSLFVCPYSTTNRCTQLQRNSTEQ